MNGVRRLLGGGGQRSQPPPPMMGSPTTASFTEPPLPPLPPLQTTAPLVISKPSWPPTPLTASQGLPAPVKQEQSQNKLRDSSSSHTVSYSAQPVNNRRSSDDAASSPSRSPSAHASPSRKPVPMSPTSVTSPTSTSGRATNAIAGPSSPPARPLPSRVAQLSHKAVIALDPTWKRSTNMVDTRDELLMSLLASEAIVESHDCEILSSEEVEELKKEHQVLDARIEAMNKKLTLEKKIRDAAVSLAKVNMAHKTVSKQSTEQLEAANRKVETVQKELWRILERSNEITRKLLEHRAGVLSISVKNLEAKVTGHETDDSGYGTSFRSAQMSPTSSEMSHATSSFKGKFEGPHLFAGHADAVQPMSPKRKKSASSSEIMALEEKLKDMAEKLKEAKEAQQVAKRELSHAWLEKAELETTMGMELQSAEDKIASLEDEARDTKQLEDRLEELEREREEWEAQRTAHRDEVEALEQRLEAMEEQSGEMVGLQLQLDEFEGALDRLKEIMMTHGVIHNTREGHSFTAHLESLDAHLEKTATGAQEAVRSGRDRDIVLQELERERRVWEEEKRKWAEEKQSLVNETQTLQRERDAARREVKALEIRARSSPSDSPTSPTVTLNGDGNFASASPDLKKFMNVLHPVWAALPSAETRAAKLGARKGSPTAAPGSPQTSLSELDVRLLKNLYDGRPVYHQLENGAGNSTGPPGFTAESFAQRVQALMADDKALIERLIRFAQAHELLKKNAERAQKLAQESSIALETYQKQVKTLEERNMNLTAHHAAMQDEVRELQESVDRIMAEKREVETQAAAQAETCRQLTEANATLSAKALSLAEEAAAAPEAVRRQLEQQLAQCQSALVKAEEEVNAMRNSEQTQRVALLDELNSVQTVNESLRAQLRAAGKR